MRRVAVALMALAGGTLVGCASSDYSDGGYYDRPVYRSAPSRVYRGYPPYGWGRDYGHYDHDDDDDDDKYVRAPWRRSQSQGRFVSQGNKVVCDRQSNICYKNGHIDKTETKDYFGNGASRRADDLRDEYETGNVFVPRKGVVCNDENNRCYRNDRPNRRLTRDFFGKNAAQRIDNSGKRRGRNDG